MIADAASCWSVSILEFDKDPYLFNCLNCTLNLRDFSVHKHNPNDYLSKVANVDYDEKAECARWESFVSEIMRGDVDTAKFLQKALGYTLTGDTSEECFFILYGSTTRNGKGTMMETTLHMLGDYGRTAQPETVAQKQFASSGNPSEDIARLKGARFVNMSEPDKGLRLNSALVKQVTGGDSVTARFLHQNSFEYRPEYKLFINTNHLPRVTDDSIFASGRVKLIPFERHFSESEQDKGLKGLFKEVKNVSGIFNWFINGLRLIQAEGLEQPKAIRDATAQYREESDTVGLFIGECLVEIPDIKTPLKEIHTTYEKWCNENGYSPINRQSLARELRRNGLAIEKKTGRGVRVLRYGISASDNEIPEEWLN
jgi:putative DNA primase/helicase